MRLELLLQLRDHTILHAGGGFVVAARQRLRIADLRIVQGGADLADIFQRRLLLLPLRRHLIILHLQALQFLLKFLQPLLGGIVLLLLERNLLNLQAPHMPRDLVQFLRLRIELRADARAGLVQEVDRLVRQEPILDVARREHHGADERRVLDVDVVILLKTLLQTAQDRDGILLRGRIHLNRLETPFERGILLHVLAVFVERRRAHAVQFAARQHRLEHVAGVGTAFRLARAHDRMNLVDKEDDLPLRLLDRLQHGLQTFFELSAVHGPRHQRRHVERKDRPVFQPFWHVAAHDTLGETFNDGRLADARFADEDRVVLGFAGQNSDDVTDFRVAANHGIELAGTRTRRQVVTKLLQRILRVLFNRIDLFIHGLFSFSSPYKQLPCRTLSPQKLNARICLGLILAEE